MSAWTVAGDRELRNWSSTRPPMLNVDSEATVDIGIARTCCATFESVLYFKALLLFWLICCKKNYVAECSDCIL